MQAFIIASTSTEEEMHRWYKFKGYLLSTSLARFALQVFSDRNVDATGLLLCRYEEHVVWTDKDLNLKLMRKGLLTRIHSPQVL